MIDESFTVQIFLITFAGFCAALLYILLRFYDFLKRKLKKKRCKMTTSKTDWIEMIYWTIGFIIMIFGGFGLAWYIVMN